MTRGRVQLRANNSMQLTRFAPQLMLGVRLTAIAA
jgi:hypothetical protein